MTGDLSMPTKEERGQAEKYRRREELARNIKTIKSVIEKLINPSLIEEREARYLLLEGGAVIYDLLDKSRGATSEEIGYTMKDISLAINDAPKKLLKNLLSRVENFSCSGRLEQVEELEKSIREVAKISGLDIAHFGWSEQKLAIDIAACHKIASQYWIKALEECDCKDCYTFFELERFARSSLAKAGLTFESINLSEEKFFVIVRNCWLISARRSLKNLKALHKLKSRDTRDASDVLSILRKINGSLEELGITDQDFSAIVKEMENNPY